jgi:hypothetical protein
VEGACYPQHAMRSPRPPVPARRAYEQHDQAAIDLSGFMRVPAARVNVGLYCLKRQLEGSAGGLEAQLMVNVRQCIRQVTTELESGGLCYGHGTGNPSDEAAWLVLHAVGAPLDGSFSHWDQAVTSAQEGRIRDMLERRISQGLPLAYICAAAGLRTGIRGESSGAGTTLADCRAHPRTIPAGLPRSRSQVLTCARVAGALALPLPCPCHG